MSDIIAYIIVFLFMVDELYFSGEIDHIATEVVVVFDLI